MRKISGFATFTAVKFSAAAAAIGARKIVHGNEGARIINDGDKLLVKIYRGKGLDDKFVHPRIAGAEDRGAIGLARHHDDWDVWFGIGWIRADLFGKANTIQSIHQVITNDYVDAVSLNNVKGLLSFTRTFDIDKAKTPNQITDHGDHGLGIIHHEDV